MDDDRSERVKIAQVEQLWAIGCQYLLGALSKVEYRHALAIVCTGSRWLGPVGDVPARETRGE